MGVYDRAIATARRLIQAKGRQVEFRKASETPADPAAPWSGPAIPSTTGGTGVLAYAVQIPLESAIELGLMTKADAQTRDAEQLFIVEQPATGEELETYETLVDGGQVLRVERTQVLKPGTQRILYSVEATR